MGSIRSVRRQPGGIERLLWRWRRNLRRAVDTDFLKLFRSPVFRRLHGNTSVPPKGGTPNLGMRKRRRRIWRRRLISAQIPSGSLVINLKGDSVFAPEAYLVRAGP